MNKGEGLSEFPFVDRARLRKAAVICHRNADVDAYLSAYGISSLLRALAPGCSVDIATPDGMTVLTSKVAERFPHQVVQDSDEEYDLYVAVDVGDTELLRGWRSKLQTAVGQRVLVDHHPFRDAKLYDHLIVDEEATSAAEVVFSLFKATGVEFDPTTAQALLVAVLFDSSHLAIAGGSALRAVVELLDAGAELTEARRVLRSEPNYGEVIAKLKGAQRLKVYRVGDWVASTSEIGSFQAHVARALILLGSDLAVVGGETEGETRVSLRATQRFADITKLQIGTEVAEEVVGRLGGHGGGHATAASFATVAPESAAVDACLKRIGELLGSEVHEIA